MKWTLQHNNCSVIQKITNVWTQWKEKPVRDFIHSVICSQRDKYFSIYSSHWYRYLIDWGVVFSLSKWEANAGIISPSVPSPTITILGFAVANVFSIDSSLGTNMLGCCKNQCDAILIFESQNCDNKLNNHISINLLWPPVILALGRWHRNKWQPMVANHEAIAITINIKKIYW